MTLELVRQLTLQQRLDDLAAELLARAVALDNLAADIEHTMKQVRQREKTLRERERDVLNASAEIVAMRDKLQRGEIDYARRPAQ
jgi:phage shock protein A